MDERGAIELCLTHQDPMGFEWLVNKYRREALFHARTFLGNTEDAADACQESFAKAFIAFPKLKSLPNFYPWFYCILRNHCLNCLRRKKSSQKYINESIHEESDESRNPDFIIDKAEEQTMIWQVLDSLNPEFREILAMKYLKDLRYDEISQLLDIPRGTVMSRLYHARLSFKEKYIQLFGSDNLSESEVQQ